MALPDDLEHKLKQLESAAALIEAAAEQRRAQAQEMERLYTEVARLSTDRARLAQLLDGEMAKSKALDEANRDVSRKIVIAMESVRRAIGEDVPA